MITPADRLRWVRELYEPWVPSIAAVSRVSAKLWEACESGTQPIPLYIASNAAHRFGVTLDYIYLGRLEAIDENVLEALVDKHPEIMTETLHVRYYGEEPQA